MPKQSTSPESSPLDEIIEEGRLGVNLEGKNIVSFVRSTFDGATLGNESLTKLLEKMNSSWKTCSEEQTDDRPLSTRTGAIT